MRAFSGLGAIGIALLLAGCASSDEGAASESGAPSMPDAPPSVGSMPGDDPTSGEEPGAALPDPDPRGCAGFATSFMGDEACMEAPDPSEGFQIHIGPDDYDDPDQTAVFLMEPGGESSECYMKKTANDRDIFYATWELSGRPGTHHIINTLRASDLPDGFGPCVQFAGQDAEVIGELGGASNPWMPRRPTAPENEGLGIPLAAHTQGQHDMHYFNTTEEPILREFWQNVYYIDEADVTEIPTRIMGLGGLSWSQNPIQPGTHEVYQYSCDIPSDGRIVQLLGHTHAHGIRETAYIEGGGVQTKVFEQFDYTEPQIFWYDSVTQNPDFSEGNPGAYTGVLDVHAGDRLIWECEVRNDSAVALRYVNDVFAGEMCNIWGQSVGPLLNCYGL